MCVGVEYNVNVNEVVYGGVYASVGKDFAFSAERFRETFALTLMMSDEEWCVFEFEGCLLVFVNVFWRIIFSEVLMMVIEKVFVVNNTSVVADEVFAYRFGLVSIKVDLVMFEY